MVLQIAEGHILGQVQLVSSHRLSPDIGVAGTQLCTWLCVERQVLWDSSNLHSHPAY